MLILINYKKVVDREEAELFLPEMSTSKGGVRNVSSRQVTKVSPLSSVSSPTKKDEVDKNV